MLTSVPYNSYWEQARHNTIMLSYYYKSRLPLTKQPNTDIVTQEK